MVKSNDSIKEAKERIAFNNTVSFLADMVIKYGDMLQPATLEDVLEYLNRKKNKSA